MEPVGIPMTSAAIPDFQHRPKAEAQAACRDFIGKNYGTPFVPEKPNFFRTKSTAQGAHEAIRPTDVNLTPEKLKDYFLEKQTCDLRWQVVTERFIRKKEEEQ